MNNLTAIAAMSRNRVIGANGKIPWHLPRDLKLFKGKTLGHTVIMGRKTWDSLPNGALPNRTNVVMSRYLTEAWGGWLAPDLRGLELALQGEPAFVIGGAEIYRLLMPWTTEVLLTVLDREAEGDTFMPEFEDQFETPEIIDRAPGVEWRRYTRKQPDTNV